MHDVTLPLEPSFGANVTPSRWWFEDVVDGANVHRETQTWWRLRRHLNYDGDDDELWGSLS